MKQTKTSEPILDASTFQKPLRDLAETLAQKVKREGPSLLSAPEFVATDLHVLIRQVINTYELLFYINADERRQTDCHWRTEYSIVSLPLIRNMIDCLYNIRPYFKTRAKTALGFERAASKNRLQAFRMTRRSTEGGPNGTNGYGSPAKKKIF